MARKKKHIARREVRLLSVQDTDVNRAIAHLKENGYPSLEFSEFARSVLWEFAKEILGETHRRPFVDAKVSRRTRKDEGTRRVVIPIRGTDTGSD